MHKYRFMVSLRLFVLVYEQVRQMVAYAAGEVISADAEDEEGEGVGVAPGHVTRWRPSGLDRCYEIVTAWVDPRFRGLNFSWHMYATIFQQGKTYTRQDRRVTRCIVSLSPSAYYLSILISPHPLSV